MFDIKKIDLNSKNAEVEFYQSFQNTGFAVIKNHSISDSLLNEMYLSWEKFFNSEEKYHYKFTEKSQDGFFPFRTESAKNNPIKDLKEFFHVYPKTNLPNDLEYVTRLLYKELVKLGSQLLKWIENQTPKKVKNYKKIVKNTH